MRDYPAAPFLQALIERSGGYEKIPREAWAGHNAAMAQWHIDRRIATAGYAERPQIWGGRTRGRKP